MRKADIIDAIVNQTGVEKVDAIVIVEAFFTEIKETVLSGDYVSIHGFGVFKPVLRAEKKARNILAGTDVIIPQHYAPKFSPSESFMQIIRAKDFKK